MKTLPRDKASALFDQYWDRLKHEWFKLEVLQDYSGEDFGPSLRAWLAGDQKKSIRLMRESADKTWVADCQHKVKSGIKLVRVHIIEKPLTPYLEWELEYYQRINKALCGENVYLVHKPATATLDIPPGDMIIFDNEVAAINQYDSSGKMTSQDFYDNDDISPFLELKSELLKLAKSAG